MPPLPNGARTPKRPREPAAPLLLYVRTHTHVPVPPTLAEWVTRWAERTFVTVNVMQEPEAPAGGLLILLTSPDNADVQALWRQLSRTYEVGFVVGDASTG